MAVRLTKTWQPVAEVIAKLHGHLGVFELADANEEVVYIGFAGGASAFGLKGEVTAAFERCPQARYARVEVNTAYRTRHRELLMAHVADHGGLPACNPPINLGRLSPA